MTSDESQQSSSNGADGDDGRTGWAKAGMGMALGFEFVGFIAAGILVGHWVDQQLGIAPVALLVGMFAAIIAASLHIYRMANRLMATETDDDT